MFKGVFTAIVTPFKKGRVDLDSLGKLLDFNLKNGVAGIVPCGTTGEAPTLDEKEYLEVIRYTVEKTKGKCKVIAGTGSNSTRKAVENTHLVKEAKADGALIVTPYYNKPTQNGLKLHYETIAKEVDIPIIIYNVPGRTSVNMLPETLESLCRLKNIAGIKEASGSLIQIAEMRNRSPKDFAILSGDDQLFLPTLAIGGDGIISVASNIIPNEMKKIYELFLSGNFAASKELFLKVFPLTNALFLETNPIPVKAALNLMGYIDNELRAPLCPIGEENLSKLKKVLAGFGLI